MIGPYRWRVEDAGSGSGGRPLASAARPSADAPGARADRPVLVVDDDESIVEVLRELLESEGYAVTTAANGAEALAAIEHRAPSLVLLDMRMPVMDGWSFARTLRERRLDVPVVVMTAAENARRWADEIGADGYLAKPFDIEEVLDTVERLRRRDRPN